MKLTAIILTLDEEKHLARCIESIRYVVDEILIVDSYSSDKTLEIARGYNIRILQNEWVNHSEQFNWALAQLSPSTTWVLRIDADEYLTEKLAKSISTGLSNIKFNINGIYLDRRIQFLGRSIKHGGVFPVKVLRLFRFGEGECENRWMDEHIVVNGATSHLEGEIIDDNLNSLSWWIQKHNKYSSLEAVEMLDLEYNILERNKYKSVLGLNQAGVKRWIKENVYMKLAPGLRSFIYFNYRYIIRLGFLDGWQGTAFHFLQGFWYRYLVDCKILEVKNYMKIKNCDVITAVNDVLDITIK